MSLDVSPYYVSVMQADASCDHTSISVPTTHDGEYDVEVLVHTPKVSHCYLAGLGW